jgi:hypothetical protein
MIGFAANADLSERSALAKRGKLESITDGDSREAPQAVEQIN